jgi:hypothetical protein
LLVLCYLARKAKQFPRALDRLSAARNVLNYITLPTAENLEMSSVKFNVGWLAFHGIHHRLKMGVSRNIRSSRFNG